MQTGTILMNVYAIEWVPSGVRIAIPAMSNTMTGITMGLTMGGIGGVTPAQIRGCGPTDHAKHGTAAAGTRKFNADNFASLGTR
jgi:hypothetical protein